MSKYTSCVALQLSVSMFNVHPVIRTHTARLSFVRRYSSRDGTMNLPWL